MADTFPPPETQVDPNIKSPRLFDWPSQITPAERKSLAAGGLGWMLDAMDVMLYSLVLTYLIREFSMDTRTAGFLNSHTLVASAIGGLLFGMVADRIGRTRSLMVSILVYSLASAACAFSHSVAQLAVFRFVLGLGMGGEWTAAAALIAETWRPEHRGKALGLHQAERLAAMLRPPGFRDERGSRGPFAAHAQAQHKTKHGQLGHRMRERTSRAGQRIHQNRDHQRPRAADAVSHYAEQQPANRGGHQREGIQKAGRARVHGEFTDEVGQDERVEHHVHGVQHPAEPAGGQ